MPQSVLIVSRKPGFRRAGIEHPARAEHPITAFDEAQLAQLQAEPMLEVIISGEEEPKKGKGAKGEGAA